MRVVFRALMILLLLGGLAACENIIASLPRPLAPSSDVADGEFLMRATAFKAVPGWKTDDHSAALPVFLKSCARLKKQPPDQPMGRVPEMGRVSDWIPICDDAALIRLGNRTEARYFFESRFIAYKLIQSSRQTGLITGYYEPELNGAWKPDQRYRYPLYALPKDLISANLGEFDHKWKGSQIAGRLVDGRYVPYYSRAEIERGVLSGQQLEILWTDSNIDAFFLHIQGSGKIRLPDGTFIRMGYAGRNGHRYTAVGRELVAAGVMRLRDVTMPAIRAWMEQNPVGAQALMQKNKSFVFFRVLKGDGPIGAQGVLLTPGRSLAVDRRFIPMGTPVWLETTEPGQRDSRQAKSLRRVVLAQDTGSAIKGAVRGDLFWGHGRDAATMAGIMKQKGRLFALFPRTAAAKPEPKSAGTRK